MNNEVMIYSRVYAGGDRDQQADNCHDHYESDQAVELFEHRLLLVTPPLLNIRPQLQ